MEDEKVNLSKYAMQYGTYMGIYWGVKFIFFPMGLANPLLMFLFVIMTVAVPFIAYFMTRSFRDRYCGGTISFTQAWVFNAFMYMFAGLLAAIVHYIYFAYLDQGYLVNTYASLIEEVRGMKIEGMEQSLKQMEQVLDVVRNLSPIELAVQLLSQNVIYGAILALPVAFFVKRKPFGKA